MGDIEYDPATRAVRAGLHEPVLTVTELAILELLMRRSPAVVHRRSIVLNVWEEEADAVGSNTIDVHLARLRAKLATAHVRIETVRGVGYRDPARVKALRTHSGPQLAHAARIAAVVASVIAVLYVGVVVPFDLVDARHLVAQVDARMADRLSDVMGPQGRRAPSARA